MKIKKRVTRLLRSGRPESGWVNVPPTRASTFVFKSVSDWKDTRARRELERLPSYGARGNDTGHALEDALVELEQGFRCFLFPTGQAAIATTLLAFLKPGDHLLLSDAVYEPVRNFCKYQLSALGIEYSFYSPDGSDIKNQLRLNTRILYVEAPGTMTYDMVDLPQIAALAKDRDLVIVADNTWGSGWLYQPLVLGADISIMATTKYVGGHSDIMMGAAVANKRVWQQLQKAVIGFGQTTSPDDAFLALRGLRSMPVRLKAHGEGALKVAEWLRMRPEVHKVFFPELETDTNHALWKKYCKGSNGLVSFELQNHYPREKVEQMIDSLSLFGLGASWGGFESLVIPADLANSRVLSDWSQRGVIVRLHIGLEDPEDLINDLQQALQTLHLEKVDARTLKSWLHDGGEIALLDVREQGQFGENHLFFAVPAPYSRLEADIERLVPRKNTRIALIDEQENRVSRLAAQRLRELGYSAVHVLDGGITAWKAAGYVVFSGVNVPSKAFGELAEHAFHTPRISAKELSVMIENKADIVVIDGRPFHEYQKMSIPGAYCCPNGELALRIDDLVKSPHTRIIVNCAGRTRSIVGAQTLINLGLPNPVMALENGTQGWYLEDLKLEQGASRKYHENPRDERAINTRQKRSMDLAQRYDLSFVDAATVNVWLKESTRTTYLCDVRTLEEVSKNPIPGAQHTPGGQLIQATDQFIGTRGARLVIIDDENVRAPVVASWLKMLGWDAVVLKEKESGKLLDFFESNAMGATGEDFISVSAREIKSLLDAGAILCDLRSSMQYRSAHIAGAIWSIRPRLDILARHIKQTGNSLVIIANDRAIATLAAKDAHSLGFEAIYACMDEEAEWESSGLQIETTPDIPSNEECIDYLFFVHDRHDGNKQAARQYLAWETNLLTQIDEDEKNTYQLP